MAFCGTQKNIIHRVLKIHSISFLPEDLKGVYWGFILLGAIKPKECIRLTEYT
jgi:hypothetical protein